MNIKLQTSHSFSAWLRAAGLTAVTFAALGTGQAVFADSSLNWKDRHFLTETADDNHEAAACAQLAAQQASDPSVRAFAQQLAADHRQLGQDLGQLGQQKSLALDTGVTVALPAVTVTSTANPGDNTVVPLGGPNASLSGSNMGALTDTPTGNRIEPTGTSVSPGVTQASANPASDRQVLAATGSSTGGATSYQYAGTGTATATVAATSGSDDRKYRRLARMSGADFDREYIAMTVSAEQKEVSDFDQKSRDASDADVRAFAAKELPTLQAHLDRAQSLAQNLK
ncbi:MAG TPA: DUF4142 domain-containing protein [Opitutaceae bacterium]|nr:DUF4142 domain-containing protein [Opitutaceae bacterium]